MNQKGPSKIASEQRVKSVKTERENIRNRIEKDKQVKAVKYMKSRIIMIFFSNNSWKIIVGKRPSLETR